MAPTRLCLAGLPAVEGDPRHAEDFCNFVLRQTIGFPKTRTDVRRRHDVWPRE